jgi:hypothetical protein
MTTKIICETCSAQGDLIAGDAHLPCGHQYKFYVPLNDARSELEKKLWDIIGPPLYYCAECLLEVKVTPVEGAEPIVKRRCEHTGQIIAPRKATCVGKGGMSALTRLKVTAGQIASSLTGRSV